MSNKMLSYPFKFSGSFHNYICRIFFLFAGTVVLERIFLYLEYMNNCNCIKTQQNFVVVIDKSF